MTIKILDNRRTVAAVLLLVVALVGSWGAVDGQQCFNGCFCKWKGGKQTVECIDTQLITIPENLDQNTQVLDMSGNNLQQLPRETFIRLDLLNLQKLFLRNCRLGHIDDEAFKGLTNLVELDLSHNLLTGIPSSTFSHVPSLRDLTLSKNPIQKIESLAFQTVPNLVKLDLSHCDLSMIAPQAFEGLDLLHSLKLNGNKLSELRPRTVETLSRLHGVELHDNPWLCDCRLRAAKIWLTENNIPYPVAPVCSGGPERVIDRTFDDLQVDDFACRPEMLPVGRFIEAFSGENATLVCRTGAVPSASINWYWNGRVLMNNTAFSAFQKVHIYERGEFEKQSELVITNAQESDSSEFYCVAENRAGNAEANFTLHVTMRTGITTFGNGQIAGLSIALVVLILFILLIILFLLVRLRRMPFTESKTPGQLDTVITTVSPTTNNNPNNNNNSINNNLHLTSPSSNNNHINTTVVGKACNVVTSTASSSSAVPVSSVAIPNNTISNNNSSLITSNHCYKNNLGNSRNNSDVVLSSSDRKTASDMKIASTNNHINSLRTPNHHLITNNNSSSNTSINSSPKTALFQQQQQQGSTNPVQKPPRLTDMTYTTSHYDANGSVLLATQANCKYMSPSSTASNLLANFNNPDLINDTQLFTAGNDLNRSTDANFGKLLLRPDDGSGEYSRAGSDSLYPSGLWDTTATSTGATTTTTLASSANPEFNSDPYSLKRSTNNVNLDDEHSSAEFMCRTFPRQPPAPHTTSLQSSSSQQPSYQYSNSSIDVSGTHSKNIVGYPPDYGLPIVPGAEHEIQKSFREPLQQPPGMPTNAKTLRVWQRGGVPVLPPVTALKRALTSSRNSPDEGYQEGCGTDV